jgi:hypothetical protein
MKYSHGVEEIMLARCLLQVKTPDSRHTLLERAAL